MHLMFGQMFRLHLCEFILILTIYGIRDCTGMSHVVSVVEVAGLIETARGTCAETQAACVREKRRDESAVSVEQPDALRGIIAVYQIEMITALSQSTPSSLWIEAWILRWFTKSGLVCGNWLLDWQANYIKDKYTVYMSPPLWQVGLDLGLWFPSSHRVCLSVCMGNTAGGVVWFLL